MDLVMPRYPVYIPSKGRADNCLTPERLLKDNVPFYLVVEEQEASQYASRFGKERLLILPFANLGSVVPARNWIKAHATAAGHVRHWQLDDNIRRFYRRWQSKRLHVRAGMALRICEDFTERFANVAVSGLNYTMFLPDHRHKKPFTKNVHVYSCSLILNEITQQWRGRYNEDTDLCLQVLAAGWCTLAMNVVNCAKVWTCQMHGGNTADLYQADGRLRMARALERLWPGVVTTRRRFHRPQHVIAKTWKMFDTPLRLREGVDPDEPINEFGMKLVQNRKIQSANIQRIYDLSVQAPS